MTDNQRRNNERSTGGMSFVDRTVGGILATVLASVTAWVGVSLQALQTEVARFSVTIGHHKESLDKSFLNDIEFAKKIGEHDVRISISEKEIINIRGELRESLQNKERKQ